MDIFILPFKNLNRHTKIILIIQVIAMLMGTSTHVAWAIENGFLSSNYGVSWPSMLFWDSLTFLDPLAALLLLIKPKQGIYLTFFIILADILHNNFIYFDELYLSPIPIREWVIRYWMILGQLLFATFVLVTLKSNLRAVNSIQ